MSRMNEAWREKHWQKDGAKAAKRPASPLSVTAVRRG
jgi:hypothetical protein